MHGRNSNPPPQRAEDRAEDAIDAGDAAVCAAYLRAGAAGSVEGLYGPQSLAWEMWREPLLLLAAAPAVLLQMAHPAVSTGVARFSDFRSDILKRARNTYTSLYELVFGDLDTALAASRRLHLIHRRVRGVVEGGPAAGSRFRANEPALLRWVGATTAVCGLELYEQMIRPLGEAEREQWYREYRLAAASTGIRPDALPETRQAYLDWYEAELNGPNLCLTPLAREIADALFNSPITRGPFDETLTAGLLPPRWREAYGLRWGARERAGFRAMMGGLRAWHRLTPGRARYAVAWHQAQLRLAQQAGRRGSLQGRLLNAIDRRWDLPTSIQPLAADVMEGGYQAP